MLGEISMSLFGSRMVWGICVVVGEFVLVVVFRLRVDDGWLKDDVVLEMLGVVDMIF